MMMHMNIPLKMTKRLQKHIDYLSVLCKCKRKQRQAMLESADGELIKTICDCVENTLAGKVPLSPSQRKRLSRYKKKLRDLRNSKRGLRVKRTYLVQKGGFLPALLAPILGVVGGLVTDLILKR